MAKTEHDSLYFLEKAPVPKAIAHMAIPMTLSMVLDLVYNLVNAFFIGQLSNTAMMAAITLAFPFQILLMGVAQIFGVGAGTLIARLLGEKNEEAVKRTSAVAFYLSLAAGVLVTVVLLPILQPLLGLMGIRGEALTATSDYLVVMLLGSPFVIATIALAELIRSEGASTASMTGMVISIVINICLDPLLIFVFKMNVTGAALATVLANFVAVAFFVRHLAFKSPYQSLKLRDFRPTKALLADIFQVGFAAFLFSTLMIVAALVFNVYALKYGDSVVAAFGVANRLVQIVEFLGSGIFAGIVPLMAYSYASGNHHRLSQVIRTSLTVFATITLVLGTLFFVFRIPIFSLFSGDPQVLQIGFVILAAMLLATLFSGISSIYTDVFQAFGAGLQSNAMALIRGLALVPMIVLGNLWFGLEGTIWSLMAAEVTASILGTLLWLASRKKLMSRPLERRGGVTAME